VKRVCLVADIGFDGVERSASAGNDKITWGPEGFAPESLCDLRKALHYQGVSISVKQEETLALPRVRSESPNKQQVAA
jgi:hypothetical protein